jgi:hypothetical protein
VSDDIPFEPATPRPYFPPADLALMDADQLRAEAERYRFAANHFHAEFVGAIASHVIANEALRGLLDALHIPADERKISGGSDEDAGRVAYRHFYRLARGRTGSPT